MSTAKRLLEDQLGIPQSKSRVSSVNPASPMKDSEGNAVFQQANAVEGGGLAESKVDNEQLLSEYR
jgi:hypothetical protein